MIAQLSDPHMRLPSEDEGSGEALAAAVRSVLALDPLPDAVIATSLRTATPCGSASCGWSPATARSRAEGFTIVREPPAFAVHALVDGGVVSHQPV